MGKYQENWNCGKYEMGKYYQKFEKCEIGNMENVKDDNINKRGSIVGGTNVKIRKSIQWNKYYYYKILNL